MTDKPVEALAALPPSSGGPAMHRWLRTAAILMVADGGAAGRDDARNLELGTLA
jgi:hypothetical protein